MITAEVKKFEAPRSNPLFTEVPRALSSFEKFYKLEGTGFNIPLQVNQFASDLQAGLREGKRFNEVYDGSFQKIEQDIQGFKTEYLLEGLLFPIVLDKKVVNGTERVVAPLYNDKLLVDTTTEQERNGSVKNSLVKVENFLLTASPGSIAVMSSPDGWSGFNGIEYQDTQTYVWQVQKDGNVRGFTIRTDMTLAQNKKLLIGLGVDEGRLNGKNKEEEIANIVSNPVFLDSREKGKDWEIEDMVDVIRYVKGSEVAYKGKKFDEIYATLKNPDHLWTLDNATKNLTDNLKEYIRMRFLGGGIRREEVEAALGMTILMLAQKIRGSSEEKYQKIAPNTVDYASFGKILADLRSLPGCNGGGKKFGSIIDSVTPRLAKTPGEQEWFNCPKCGYQADGPVGDSCPNCRITKEQFSVESGQEVCD